MTNCHYEQYDELSHITSIGIWLRNAIVWIRQRLIGLPAVQNCLSIAPGNRLGPIPVPSQSAEPDDSVGGSAAARPLDAEPQ